MLLLKNGAEWIPLRCDDYQVLVNYDGVDQLRFDIQREDDSFRLVTEEAEIFEASQKQYYVVRYIQSNGSGYSVKADLDVDDWRSVIASTDGTQSETGYTNFYLDAVATIAGVAPDGWTVVDESGGDHYTDRVLIDMDAPTPLDVVLKVEDSFFCSVRFDTWTKTATIVWPDDHTDSGVRYSLSKNLRSAPSYSGKSSGLCTRLYCYGADGMTFASINDGIPYVENNKYSAKIIADSWVDDSYDDAQLMLTMARRKIEILARPTKEWNLDIVDLYSIDKNTYSDMKTDMHQVIEVYDETRDEVFEARVTDMVIYPHYPEQNKLTVTTGWSSNNSIRKTLESLTNNRTKNTIKGEKTRTRYLTYTHDKKNRTYEFYYNRDEKSVSMTSGTVIDYGTAMTMTYAYYKTAALSSTNGYVTDESGRSVGEAYFVIDGAKLKVKVKPIVTGSYKIHIYAYAKMTY